MEETWSWSSFYLVVSSLSLLFLIFIPTFISKQNRQRRNLPLASASLPVIDHLLLIMQHVDRTLKALSCRYEPILTLSFGSRTMVVISNPSAVEECFTRNYVILAKWPQLPASKHVSYSFTSLGSTNYGIHWQNLRRITTMEILSMSRLDSFLGIRRKEVRLHVKGLYLVVSEWSIVRVEMRMRLQDLTFNIIMRMITGKRHFGAVEEAAITRRPKCSMKPLGRFSSWQEWSELLPALRWLNLSSKYRRSLQGLVNKHKKRSKDGDQKTMIDFILSMQDSDPENAWSKAKSSYYILKINNGY